MSLEEVAMAAAELLEVMAKQSPPPPVLLWHKGPQIAKALRAALAEAEKAEPVPWTNEEATAVAWQAGFAGTSWSMGPEEFAHALTVAQIPPRRELSEEVEAVIACLEDDAAWLREQMTDNEIATNMDEAAKLLRTMQPRRELSDEEIAACLPGAEPFFALVGSEEILKFARAVLLRAAGGEG